MQGFRVDGVKGREGGRSGMVMVIMIDYDRNWRGVRGKEQVGADFTNISFIRICIVVYKKYVQYRATYMYCT